MTDGPITQQKPAWYSRDGDPVSKGSFVNSLLAYDVFKDSMMFPFVLTLIGLGVIYLGIIWQRHEETTSGKLRRLLPQPMRELIEQRH
jgi:hypothetical protein